MRSDNGPVCGSTGTNLTPREVHHGWGWKDYLQELSTWPAEILRRKRAEPYSASFEVLGRVMTGKYGASGRTPLLVWTLFMSPMETPFRLHPGGSAKETRSSQEMGCQYCQFIIPSPQVMLFAILHNVYKAKTFYRKQLGNARDLERQWDPCKELLRSSK